MENIIIIFMMAIIGAVIGYITNVIAIKLIFRPIVPIKIPILNIEILGLIPKRRKEIARTVGEIVQNEFISIDEILKEAIKEEDKKDIVEYIKIRVKLVIDEKMTMLPSGIKSIVFGYIETMIEEELLSMIDDLSEEVTKKVQERINILEIVEEKINALDLYEIEAIILKIAKTELRHIEMLGLVLGFFIGTIQGIIVTFI